jgi:hypothetical protein
MSQALQTIRKLKIYAMGMILIVEWMMMSFFCWETKSINKGLRILKRLISRGKMKIQKLIIISLLINKIVSPITMNLI